MIIFDLDGTLANCEHRRHFVEDKRSIADLNESHLVKKFKPDWKSFYEACDKDVPIQPVWRMFVDRLDMGLKNDIQIWSGRCESVRDKTEKWLMKYLSPIGKCDIPFLKMRPIGDYTPDDELKERWLDEFLSMPGIAENRGSKNKIDFVFDDRPKVVRMWRKREIFVFDCNQTGKEF